MVYIECIINLQMGPEFEEIEKFDVILSFRIIKAN